MQIVEKDEGAGCLILVKDRMSKCHPDLTVQFKGKKR